MTTIPQFIDYVTPSEVAICLHEAGHAAAALLVGVAPALVELTKDPGGFNELASMLLANKQADVKLDGRFNSTPIKFTVSCKFYVTVTANTL